MNSEYALPYRSLNVTHLLDDELEYELAIRGVKYASEAALETSQRIVEEINRLKEVDLYRQETDLDSEPDNIDEHSEEGFDAEPRAKASTPYPVREPDSEVQHSADMFEKLMVFVEQVVTKKFDELKQDSGSSKVESLRKKQEGEKFKVREEVRKVSREPRKYEFRMRPGKAETENELSDSSAEEGIESRKVLKRRPRSVAEWKLKYDGRDEGRNLNRFITEVEFMAEAEGIDKESLFNEAIHLFVGDARAWYIEGKKSRDFRNWTELVSDLKMEYQPPDMDFHYEQQASQRRQRRSEKFQDFYASIMEIFGRMADPPSEDRMFQIVFRNLRSDYKNSLLVKGVKSLRSLKIWGRKLDAANWSLYRGSTFNEPNLRAQVNEVFGHSASRGQRSNENTWNNHGAQRKLEWRNSNHTRSAKDPSTNGFGKKYYEAEKNRTTGQNTNQERRRDVPEAGSSRGTLDRRVSEYRKPNPTVCFNCRGNYHHYSACLKEREVFCTVCGFHDFVKESCPEAEVAEFVLSVEGDNRPFTRINVMGISMLGLLDCGAQLTVIGTGSRKLLRDLKLKMLPTSVKLSAADGTNIGVQGSVDMPVTFDGQTRIVSTLVAPGLKRRLILGMNFWKIFNIEPTIKKIEEFSVEELEGEEKEGENLTPDQIKQIEEVKKQFKVFVEGEKLEATPVYTAKIEFLEEFRNEPPIRLNPYPWSPEVQKSVNEELDKWIESGVVERSNSDWALLIVPVMKKETLEDGTERMKVRMCLDARKLNARTRRDAYPLPHQDRILSRLGASKYLSTIDLSKAFWQVPLDPQSRKYTAFRVFGRGLFQFRRLPFGLVNSSAVLSKVMDETLGYGELEPNVFVYLDDIVIASNTFDDHIRSLKEVARRLEKANLTINLEKSKFCVPELPYLGFILSGNGVRPNPDKIEAIINFERPTSVRSLRRFLGMTNYYRRFISEFSETTAPLTNLLKGKPKTVQWNAQAEEAFNCLKEKLITAPILACPDFQKPFTIQTDASDTAVAGVLTQEAEGGEHVIAYFSRKLAMSQRAWKAVEKEGAAALEAIEKFRPYVEGTHFTLITDSSALSFIMNSKWKPSSKLSRWSMLLQQFDMSIKHRKGSENVVPDALSRAVEAINAHNDDWYSKLFIKVKNSPDDYLDFKIENGKLFKYVAAKMETMDYRYEWKLCVPSELKKEILEREHDQHGSGLPETHQGMQHLQAMQAVQHRIRTTNGEPTSHQQTFSNLGA
ncbi:uncharacterized protein LOC129753338 [Uranotaenia lowii]|uniref:uncharacterized protein LOC129753338 n=1 Tax=Uranotaenia lowii TaxID=190385 RepID=UPI00247AA8C5|nr:uncharacterized protein LOC129753338 [Uranotaenia lowii]